MTNSSFFVLFCFVPYIQYNDEEKTRCGICIAFKSMCSHFIFILKISTYMCVSMKQKIKINFFITSKKVVSIEEEKKVKIFQSTPLIILYISLFAIM